MLCPWRALPGIHALDAAWLDAISAREREHRGVNDKGTKECGASRGVSDTSFITCGCAKARRDDQILLNAQIGGDIQHTRFVAFLSKKVDYRIFSIADPYRIIDLPEVEIQVPGDKPRGLVLSSRSGQLAAGKSRVVIDLVEPALVEKANYPARKRVACAPRHRLDKIDAQGVSGGC